MGRSGCGGICDGISVEISRGWQRAIDDGSVFVGCDGERPGGWRIVDGCDGEVDDSFGCASVTV